MIAIGTFLRAKRVRHRHAYIGPEVWSIAGAVGRGNVKATVAGWSVEYHFRCWVTRALA
jgi:hypothetical protein